METCKNCLHYDICTFHVTGNENEKCTHYTPTADVVPKSEVEMLQAEVDQLHALLECGGVFANSVEDWQKFLNEKRAEVAREIFEEIEDIIQDRKNEEIKRQGDNKMMSPFTYSFGVLEIIEHQYAELKKKYTEA